MVTEAGGAEAGPHIWVFSGGGTKVTPLNGTLDEGWGGRLGLRSMEGEHPESEGTLRPRMGGQN